MLVVFFYDGFCGEGVVFYYMCAIVFVLRFVYLFYLFVIYCLFFVPPLDPITSYVREWAWHVKTSDDKSIN